MKSRLEGLLTILLTLAAVVMAGAVVKREVFGGSASTTAPSVPAPVFHAEWVEARAIGIELANPEAALQIIEFLDLECPACALYHGKAIQPFISSADPADYSFVVVHRPLDMHRFAVPAARAAECADAQGAFRPFVEAALRQQSTFSSSPWVALAEQGGVEDTALFSACVNDEREFPRVSRGIELATRMGVNATPSIIVNGWEVSALPNLASFQRFVDEIKAGRDIREVVERR
jgi:protein-disulfide isomerase